MENKLLIDPDLQGLIPPLSPDEYIQLETNIKAEGCRDSLVVWKDTILDGHNRFEICNRLNLPFKTVGIDLKDRDSAIEWIICNQLGRRNLTRDQWEYLLGVRYNLAKKEKGFQEAGPGRGKTIGQNDPMFSTADLLAAEYGVSAATVKRAGKTAELLDENPEEKESVIKKRKRIRVVKKDIAKAKRKIKRQQAMKATTKLDTRIIIGDFRDHADKVADGSVSLIFTDPPYDRKSSKMLPDLAKFAASKLAEGGSLICYVGQTQLHDALDAFDPHLRYWWEIACVHAGRPTVMREYAIDSGWKPVLWYVKVTRDDTLVMVDDVMSGGKEKEYHEWQQAQSEAEYWIGKLCPIDGIVCDPFLGSGTTAMAAIALKRNWLGFEIDESTALIASKRIKLGLHPFEDLKNVLNMVA